jgi:hypothetical protein
MNNPYRQLAGLQRPGMGCGCLPGIAGVGAPYAITAGVHYDHNAAGLQAALNVAHGISQRLQAFEAEVDAQQFAPDRERATAHLVLIESNSRVLDGLLSDARQHVDRWLATTPAIVAAANTFRDLIKRLLDAVDQAAAGARQAQDNARAAMGAGDKATAAAWLQRAEQLGQEGQQAHDTAKQAQAARAHYLDLVTAVVDANDAMTRAARSANKSSAFALSRAEAAIEKAWRGQFQASSREALERARKAVEVGDRAVDLLQRDAKNDEFMNQLGKGLRAAATLGGAGLLLLLAALAFSGFRK